MAASSTLAFLTRRRTRPSDDTVVEKHDEHDPSSHDGVRDLVALAFVKLACELLLREKVGNATCRGDVARDERRQRRDVELFDLPCRGDRLAVLIDDQDCFRKGIPMDRFTDLIDPLKLLFVHDELILHPPRLLPDGRWSVARKSK